jgi:polygalacturonase
MKFSEFDPATSAPALADNLVGFILPLAPDSNQRWTFAQAARATNVYNSTVNVRDFGAVGDGATDCTQAFNDAKAALPAQGSIIGKGIILVPPGVYVISS